MLMLLAGIVLISVVSLNLYWWIDLSFDASGSLAQVHHDWLMKFPEALRDPFQLTVMNLLFSGGAVVLFWQSKKEQRIKILSWILFAYSSLVFLWMGFALM